MNATVNRPVSDLYAERAAGFDRDAEALGARSRLISNLRGLSFGVAVIAGGFALFGKQGQSAGIVAAVSALAFVILIVWHARIIEREDRARRWARVNRDAHARTTGRWRELPQRGDHLLVAGHPYAEDIDVFGPGSLYQRISVAHTRYGERALAEVLQAPASVEQIQARQEAARALKNELTLRQHVEALALDSADPPDPNRREDRNKPRQPADPEPLLRWAEDEPRLLPKLGLRIAARALPVLTVGGMVAAWLTELPNWIWGAPLFVQLILNQVTRAETWRVFNAVSSHEGAFLRYGAMLEVLEGANMDAQLMKALRARLSSGSERPSAAMKEFRSGVGWFDLRHNGLIHPFANAALMWDVNCVLKLEGWQTRYGKAARTWFQALGEFEALSSLAGLAHDEPSFTFPEISDSTRFDAVELGHPLIDEDKRVSNDVSLPRAGTALLITGSNMSGKSTLLRAMGLAAVMALAGCPVCARSLVIGRFAVRTSIRISDSLQSGVSHFYAELKKLKGVVDGASGDVPVFFLLDEILHGTNSRERQIGARSVIEQLLARGATGAVSTHDEGLVALPAHWADHVTLVHFRESVQGDTMTFDYKLRSGPVTSGNALRLMRIVGLNVPLE